MNASPQNANIWVLVPYDPSAIKKLWQNSKDEASDTSSSFIEKTFQMRFEVPPSVLSNWKAYLLNLAKKAFPSHKSEELDPIYQVYDAIQGENETSPTPRDLKLYVNQIGALHRQWGDEFSFAILSYYVLQRRQGLEITGKPHSPPSSVIPILLHSSIPEINKYLASLRFNVPQDVAQQMILAEPLRQALLRNTPGVLKDLLQQYREGFWAVLEKVSRNLLNAPPSSALAYVAACLDGFAIVGYSSRPEFPNIVSLLKDALLKVESWAPFTLDISKGITSACRIVTESAFVEPIVRSVRNTFTSPAPQGTVLSALPALIDGLLIFAEQISIANESLLKEPFPLPCDASQWLDQCEYIRGKNQRWWRLLTPQGSFQDVSAAIVSAVSTGKATAKLEDVVRVTEASFASSPDKSWSNVLGSIEQRLNPNVVNINPTEARTLFSLANTFLQLNIAGANELIRQLIELGHLYHALSNAQQANDLETKAFTISLVFVHQPSLAKPSVLGLSQQGYAILTSLLTSDDEKLATLMVTYLKGFNSISSIFSVVDAKSGQYDALVIRCLKIVCDSGKPSDLFKSADLSKRWSRLRDTLPDAQKPTRFLDLIRDLCQTEGLVQFLLSTQEGFKESDGGLYSAIAKFDIPTEFAEWCISGLQRVHKDKWTTELQTNGDLLELSVQLIKAKKELSLRVEFQDALLEYGRQTLAAPPQNLPKLLANNGDLFAALFKSSRNVLRRKLTELAMAQNGTFQDGFFDLFGDEINERANLLADDDIVLKLYSAVVERKSIAGLRWLSAALSSNPQLLESYKDQDKVTDFRDRISSELSKPPTSNDQYYSFIQSIAKSIGVQPIPPQEPNVK